MTQAIDTTLFRPKISAVFDWTVLIESHPLNFAELNSSSCHSSAWSSTKGKPLIYAQIEHLIKFDFKKFLIGLFQVDSVVKQQIEQLHILYPDCTFKCIQISDSWFFEQDTQLSMQGEAYLKHYMAIFLRHNPVQASFVWIQKIQAQLFNPLQYLKIDPHHACPLVWVKQSTGQHTADTVGFWLDVKGFAYRYKAVHTSTLRPASGSITRYCFEYVNQHAQKIMLSSADSSLANTASDEDSMVASRCFNQVSIDSEMGIVLKQSSEVGKLQQEVHYYQSLPPRLQIYFPRLVDSSLSTDTGSTGTDSTATGWYSLEYYPYKSLSQYFVYYALPLQNWQIIFERLLSIHTHFNAEPVRADGQRDTLDSEALYQFYAKKLNQRLAQAQTNPQLDFILSADSIELNGNRLHGFASLHPWLMQQLRHLSQSIPVSLIHGDLCFSNILFEPASNVIRLIDPRGDFMGSVNQGDPRYDLAKLLHSVHGRYDFMINDLFRLEQQQLVFELSMPQSEYLQQLEQSLFDKIQAQSVYPLNDLILLESLLFLTMLPLHSDQPKRQIAFLLTGLKLLNQVYAADQALASDWSIERAKSVPTSTATEAVSEVLL